MKKKKIFWAITIIICIVSGLVYVKMQDGQGSRNFSCRKG